MASPSRSTLTEGCRLELGRKILKRKWQSFVSKTRVTATAYLIEPILKREVLRVNILSDGILDLAHQRGFSLDIVSLNLGPIATGITSTPVLFCIVFSFAFVIGAVLVALRARLVILIH